MIKEQNDSFETHLINKKLKEEVIEKEEEEFYIIFDHIKEYIDNFKSQQQEFAYVKVMFCRIAQLLHKDSDFSTSIDRWNAVKNVEIMKNLLESKYRTDIIDETADHICITICALLLRCNDLNENIIILLQNCLLFSDNFPLLQELIYVLICGYYKCSDDPLYHIDKLQQLGPYNEEDRMLIISLYNAYSIIFNIIEIDQCNIELIQKVLHDSQELFKYKYPLNAILDLYCIIVNKSNIILDLQILENIKQSGIIENYSESKNIQKKMVLKIVTCIFSTCGNDILTENLWIKDLIKKALQEYDLDTYCIILSSSIELIMYEYNVEKSYLIEKEETVKILEYLYDEYRDKLIEKDEDKIMKSYIDKLNDIVSKIYDEDETERC